MHTTYTRAIVGINGEEISDYFRETANSEKNGSTVRVKVSIKIRDGFENLGRGLAPLHLRHLPACRAEARESGLRPESQG